MADLFQTGYYLRGVGRGSVTPAARAAIGNYNRRDAFYTYAMRPTGTIRAGGIEFLRPLDASPGGVRLSPFLLWAESHLRREVIESRGMRSSTPYRAKDVLRREPVSEMMWETCRTPYYEPYCYYILIHIKYIMGAGVGPNGLFIRRRFVSSSSPPPPGQSYKGPRFPKVSTIGYRPLKSC